MTFNFGLQIGIHGEPGVEEPFLSHVWGRGVVNGGEGAGKEEVLRAVVSGQIDFWGAH